MDRTIIIAGFHRSGTSLATRLVNQAGVFVGGDLIGAMPSNPFGHFEDREIVNLHDAILRDHGLTWQVGERFVPRLASDRWAEMSRIVKDRSIRHQLWGFKDPRVCLFLPQWKHLIPGAKVLVVYRPWMDSTSSLERRHAEQLFEGKGPPARHRRFWEEPDLALRMWISHNQALVDFVERYPSDSLVVPFSALAEGYPLVEVMNRRWRLSLRHIRTTEVFESTVTRPREGRQPITDVGLIREAHRVWDDLVELGRDSEGANR